MKNIIFLFLLLLVPIVSIADVPWVKISGTTPGYTGLPTTTTLSNGSFLVVWCEASVEGNADGILKQAIGTTWDSIGSPSTIVAATTGLSQSMAALLTIGSRTYLFYSKQVIADGTVNVYFRYTDNNATSWSAETIFKTASDDRLLINDGAITLSDGSHIFPVTRAAKIPAGKYYYQNFFRCAVGLDESVPSNWVEITGVFGDTTAYLNEGTLVESTQGHVICYMRDNLTMTNIYKTESSDYGLTWSAISTVSGVGSTNQHKKLLNLGNAKLLLMADNGNYRYMYRYFSPLVPVWEQGVLLQDAGVGYNVRYPVAAISGSKILYVWMWGAGVPGIETEIHVWGEAIPYTLVGSINGSFK